MTTNYQEILRRLAEPFPASEIQARPLVVSKKTRHGLAAFYVDNRAVMGRLDETCVWKNEFAGGPAGGLLCGISILVDTGSGLEWITRWDGAENTDVESVKGGLSGSMRRAANQWGIGRYLYDVEPIWAPVDERGRFKAAPKLPGRYLPARDDGRDRRATTVKADPAPAADAADEKPKLRTLSSSQLAALEAASKNKARKRVSDLYKKFQTGDLDADELVARVGGL